MENTQTQRPTPTFQRKSTKTHEKSEMGHAVHEPLPTFDQTSSRRRVERRSRRKRGGDMKFQDKNKELGVEVVCEDDEKAEVERKIEALQKIVPGGESLGVDNLFEETAGYIMTLQYQVKALRALATFFERLEKENTKFGG